MTSEATLADAQKSQVASSLGFQGLGFEVILGLYADNGQENGNYYNRL